MTALDETLLWLCAIPSPIGDEKPICDAVEKRLAALPLAGAIRRYENSLVVPLHRGKGRLIEVQQETSTRIDTVEGDAPLHRHVAESAGIRMVKGRV